MAWKGIFKEAATVGKREIIVKKSAYSEEDAAAIESWNDLTLFKVRGLNNLRVTGFKHMQHFSPQIVQLNSLLELALVDNGLTCLPEELGVLSKLRVLDVSNNQLTVLPATLYQLTCLQTLVLGHNQLTVDSFPLCSTEPFPHMQYIDVVGNKLTALPPLVYTSPSLLDIKASHNSIETLMPEIGSLVSLKSIEMHNNSLKDIPSELAHCVKLKALSFDFNPITDPRLRKVLTQFGTTKPKAVLDYIATKSSKGRGKKKGGKGKGKRSQELSESEEEKSDDDTPTMQYGSKTLLRIVRPDKFVEVKVTNGARHARPYLVCAIVRGCDLEDDFGDNYRKFITLQTKLHDTVCKKRRVATIATHDLGSIVPPIIYKSAMSHKIKLRPLDWKEHTTVRKYLDHLRASKPETVKKPSDKPYSVDAAASHISKYLPMVDPNQMVFLEDGTKNAISLPPLTNSEDTKITQKSRDIFVEVTSSTNLADAKAAMDALLIDMAHSKLLSKPPGTTGDDAPPLGKPVIPKGACPTTPAQQELLIEPVKVIDEANKLLVYYPSKNDLTLEPRSTEYLHVLRPT